MAEDVQVQGDVTIMGSASARTLHLKTLRRQWQIITLQIIATAALVGMYLEVVSTYVVGSIDHTMLLILLCSRRLSVVVMEYPYLRRLKGKLMEYFCLRTLTLKLMRGLWL